MIWDLQVEMTGLASYVRTLSAPDFRVFDFEVPVGIAWVPVPIDGLREVTGLILSTDRLLDIRLYGQIDGHLSTGGLLVLWQTLLATFTAPVVQLRNGGTGPAHVHGIAVGTASEAP